jgi:hypothetical protein
MPLLCLAAALPGGTAAAQTANDLVGTWNLASAVVMRQDGSKVEPFGPNPKGLCVFDSNGRFIYAFMRAEIPRFGSNNRMEGTSEEYKTVVQGSIAAFGTYSVVDKVIILKYESSTFPNWTGTEAGQPIVLLTEDELKWRVGAASGGGSAEVTWKRAK